MINRPALLASALLAAGCVLEPVDLANKKCDADHACAAGFSCVLTTCLPCADQDGDGDKPRECGGNDCDDSNKLVNARATESCTNGVDDDCDGKKDSEDSSCACAAGQERSCDELCAGAKMTCVGTAFGACTAPKETCNGKDDDCDTKVDEDFACIQGAKESCSMTCGTRGERTCLGTCLWGPCTLVESCNAVDDDCDTVPDNGFECERGKSTIGGCTTSCGSSGTSVCGSDCKRAACTAPAETCNGKDDDCVGGVDNGFACAKGALHPSGTSCTTSCGTTGTQRCNDACTGYTLCEAPPEYCDGHDQNCDSAVDEDLTTPAAVGDAPANLKVDSAVIASNASQVVVAGASHLSGSSGWLYFSPTRPVADYPSDFAHRLEFPFVSGQIDVAFGKRFALVAWAQPEITIAIADAQTGKITLAPTKLGVLVPDADAGTRVRVSSAGAAGSFNVTYISGLQPQLLVIKDGGQIARGPVAIGRPVGAGVRHVPIAAVDSGDFAIVTLKAGGTGGSLQPILERFDAAGVSKATTTLVTTGTPLFTEDSVDLDARGLVIAAAATTTNGTKQQVNAAIWKLGDTVPALAAVGVPAAAAGDVRITTDGQRGSVAWVDLAAGASSPTLQSALITSATVSSPVRIDVATGSYTPSFAADPDVAFDPSDWTWRHVWTDANEPLERRICNPAGL